MKNELAVMGIRGFPHVQGGVESHCQSILPNLNVTCRVYRRRPYVPENDACSYQNIRFVDLPSTRIKGVEALLHSFLATLHILLHPAKVVNVHNIGPGLFIPLLRLRGIKVVLTYHSSNYRHKHKWGPVSRLLLKLCEMVATRCASRIIFVNPSMMSQFGASVRKKSIFIPNGISAVSPSKSDNLVRELGLEPKKYALGVGRLSPEKGFELLMEASTQIPEGFKVVIAGDCDNKQNGYKHKLISMNTSGKVVFTGYVTGEMLRQLYSNAALFVLPSYDEGLSIALLEAMAAGLDIVASDIRPNQLPELSADDFFVSGDSRSLGERMNAKLDAPRQRKYDLSAYQPTRVVEQTDFVYRQLLN